MQPPQHYSTLDRIGYFVGWYVALTAYLSATIPTAYADSGIPHLSTITFSMLIATFIGAVGSYLAFGDDKKFPPSAASIGHILLGFGAGLFFTRGSLELMGHINSSEDVVLFTSFLWAVGGYFVLRLVIAVTNSDRVKSILPDWIAKILGVDK